MTLSGVGIKTSILASRILDLAKPVRQSADPACHRQEIEHLCRHGRQPRLCRRAARADQQHRRLLGHDDQRHHAHQRRQRGTDADCRDRNHGAGRGDDVLDPDHQQRPDHCPGHGAQFARRDAEPAEQPVGRSLSVFRTRHRHGGDGGDRRHSQRRRRAGGPEAADRGTQAGRCRLRHRPADTGDADGDVDFIDRGHRSVWPEARLDHLVGRKRHDHRADRLAGHRVVRSRRDQPEHRRQHHAGVQSAGRHLAKTCS